MNRRDFAIASLIAVLPTVANARQTTRYVFAWAVDHYGQVFMSNSSMQVEYRNYSAALQRWYAALRQSYDDSYFQVRTAGTPGDAYFATNEEAERERLAMFQRERNFGRTVVILPW